MYTFAQEVVPMARPLTEQIDLGEAGNAARDQLAERGFVVVSGLTQSTAKAIGVIAGQPSIVEYCHRDGEERFTDRQAVAKWHEKGPKDQPELAGRSPFVLLKSDRQHQTEVAGYGWLGYEPCDELPNSPITSAYRVSQKFQGQGLAPLLTRVVVAAGEPINGIPAEKVGLECYGDNPAAVRSYEKVGFREVARAAVERPTQDTTMPARMDKKGVVRHLKPTERIWMDLPNGLTVPA